MPKYQVVLEYTSVETYEVTLDAENRNCAKELAIAELARKLKDEPELTYSSVEEVKE